MSGESTWAVEVDIYIYINDKLFLVNEFFAPNPPLNHTNLSITFPIGSMYGVSTYIYHQNQPFM